MQHPPHMAAFFEELEKIAENPTAKQTAGAWAGKGGRTVTLDHKTGVSYGRPGRANSSLNSKEPKRSPTAKQTAGAWAAKPGRTVTVDHDTGDSYQRAGQANSRLNPASRFPKLQEKPGAVVDTRMKQRSMDTAASTAGGK